MNTTRFTLAAVPLLLATALAASGQVSDNVVGYYNRVLFPGDNLIANQLGFGVGGQYTNTLNNILTHEVADGSTFTKWEPLANQFLPVSIFSAAQTNWSLNYTLDLGEGGLLHSPVNTTNTFVGELDGSIYDMESGQYTWNPDYAPGLYLISAPVPFMEATFAQVVGRNPSDGEWVRILDEAMQTYSLTTYHDGLGWDNGEPLVPFGHAAWFDLGPVIVPEPAVGVLLAAAGTVTLLRQRRSK